MVKRGTDYKQVYLVDSLYFRNCNQQNALSNNQHITLSTPKSNQFFNNHYNIPSSTSKECDCNNLQKQIHPSFHNSREYDLNNSKPKYEFTKKRKETDSQDEDTINPPDSFLYSDDNVQIDEQQIKEDRKSNNISNTERFPYYDNYQNIAQQQPNNHDEVNNSSTENPKIFSKDILNKTKKQSYSCFICKQTFNSILLLEKHNMIKHKKHQNLNSINNNTNSDDVITENSNENPRTSIDDNEYNNNNDLQSDSPDYPPNNSNNEDNINDDEWIDIPDIVPTNSNDANSQLIIRKDIQTNLPNSNNINRRKKQTDNVRKYLTYKCGECFRGFQNYDGLKEHQLQEHGKVGSMKRSITSNMQGIINEGQKIEEINSYWCSVCEKFFQNFASLNVHLEKEHQNAPLRAKRSKMNDKIKRKKVLYYTKY